MTRCIRSYRQHAIHRWLGGGSPGPVPLGGMGDGPNFLRGQAKKRRGLAKGVTIPLAAIFAYFLSHHRK